MSTRLKNGMTTKKAWGDPYAKWSITYRGAAQRTERI